MEWLKEKSNPMVNSATPLAFAPGVDLIIIERLFAASKSILFVPAPFRLMTLRSEAASKILSIIGSTLTKWLTQQEVFPLILLPMTFDRFAHIQV
jgi:hypothetical protein